ncbi:MAG: AMP-binding protein [Pseudomonadota bacterium]
MGLRDFTLYDVISRNRRTAPGRTAFVTEGERITHAEYAARVDCLASGLLQAGLRSGERIGVLSENCLEYVLLYGAVARIGAILVPMNWRASADEIAYAITDTKPRLLVAGDNHVELIDSMRDRLPFVDRFFSLGNTPLPFESFARLMACGTDVPAAAVTADAPYLILHTAAVDGRPRGAVLTHGSMIAGSMQLIHHWRLNQTDVNLCMLPLFHVAGLGALLATQQAGGASVLLPRFDAEVAVGFIRRDRVTLTGVFPPMLSRLLDSAAGSPADLASLRTLSGLDTPETIARFETTCPDARFWVGYGQSEVSGYVALGQFRDRPGSVGLPTLHSHVAVLDESGHELPPGVSGEIAIRGPNVFDSYWNLPAETAETHRHGWHHSGDLGRFDEDGYLWFERRSPAKELIKPGGENVYPAEVERVLRQHPAIAEAVVIGVPDPEWGEAIKAVCVLRPNHAVDEQLVIEFVAARLARLKKPRHVVFVDQLPVTADGTIDRAGVKAMHGVA